MSGTSGECHCRNIAIALTEAEKGEAKAQACEKACLQRLLGKQDSSAKIWFCVEQNRAVPEEFCFGALLLHRRGRRVLGNRDPAPGLSPSLWLDSFRDWDGRLRDWDGLLRSCSRCA